jgi:hypothetical protein
VIVRPISQELALKTSFRNVVLVCSALTIAHANASQSGIDPQVTQRAKPVTEKVKATSGVTNAQPNKALSSQPSSNLEALNPQPLPPKDAPKVQSVVKSIQLTPQHSWSTIKNEPSDTILKDGRGGQITVGQLKQAVADAQQVQSRELEMIDLQQVLSKRAQSLQISTAMMKSINESTKGILQNIR